MRIITLLLSLLFSLQLLGDAQATQITKEAATAFFEQCKAQPQQLGLSKQSQKYMCACNAAQMMNKMSVEDVKAMSQQNQAGRDATNKMIIDVYAPCMEYPTRDYHYNQCLSNPNTKKLSRNTEKLCECAANEVAGYMKSNGSNVFKKILTETPNITDPMSALYSSEKFQQYAQSKLLSCVTK